MRVFAALLAAKIAFPSLAPGPASSITLTSGSIAQKPLPGGWAVVAMYGAGLCGATRQLAFEMAPVRVNCVAPHVVDTGLWEAEGAMGKAEAAEMKRVEGEKMLTGKVGRAGDVAEADVYLMRDRNVTGTVVDTNSGVFLV